MPFDIEIIGAASTWLVERLREFCEALDGDPWGEVPAGRLVLARNLTEAFHAYLPPARFAAWAERHRNRDGKAWGLGMGFIAQDGVPTAVVAAFPEPDLRNELLSLACHELVELSMADDDHQEPTTMHAALRRVVWSEHVVERRRSIVFEARKWPRPGMGREFLVESIGDYQSSYDAWVGHAAAGYPTPVELFGAWQLLARGVAVSYAHAQAGDREEGQQLERFLDVQAPGAQRGWLDLMVACDDAFGHPEMQPGELDRIGERGWMAIHDALLAQWQLDVAAHARVRQARA